MTMVCVCMMNAPMMVQLYTLLLLLVTTKEGGVSSAASPSSLPVQG
jgi:hypothetical protein